MKNILCFLMVLLIPFTGCDIDKTESGELPEVDVNVDAEAGEMPEYDVDWANVNVGTTTRVVEIPKLVVVMEEEAVEVPVVDVSIPEDDRERVERTVAVEAEVEGESAELDIQEIYATGNRLYVISTLESTGENIGDQKMRVSDQVVLNAPEDLMVYHYIIGSRPNRTFNDRFTYIDNRNAIADKLQGGNTIYTAQE